MGQLKQSKTLPAVAAIWPFVEYTLICNIVMDSVDKVLGILVVIYDESLKVGVS